MNFPVKAQVVGERLTSIYEKEKLITPELVLEDAKKKNSPLHSCFEWDDTEAANKYRLSQARDLIRSVIVVKQLDNKEIVVRDFVSIRVDHNNALTNNFFQKNATSYYVKTADAMSNDVLRKYTVDMAFRELKAFIDKYKSLTELSDLFDNINDFIESKK